MVPEPANSNVPASGLAQNLQALRERLALDLETLANLSGVPLDVVVRAERGEITTLDLETAEKLASALGVRPAVLLG